MSQKQIDETIALIAKDHPDYSINQFATEFEDIFERPPTIEEKLTFKKIISGLKTAPKPPGPQPVLPKVIGGFMFGDLLGKGSFGRVYKCQKDGKEYAVKEIDESMSTEQVEKIFADSISARLNSPFLVRYFESFRGPSGELYVVMELCPRGDMQSLIDKLREWHATLEHKRLARILIQLVLGLYTMHRDNILHRDLKPGNIFLDGQDDLKIGDLGCAKVLSSASEKACTVIGTPLYESPQVIMGEEYDTAADMWALGVILYELCTFERPFSDPNIYKLQKLITAGNYAEVPKERAPPELIAIIGSLLKKNPKQRPSALDLLRNPYIRLNASLLEYTAGKKLLSLFPPQADEKPQQKRVQEETPQKRVQEEAQQKGMQEVAPQNRVMETAFANYNVLQEIQEGTEFLVENKRTKEKSIARVITYPSQEPGIMEKGLPPLKRGEVLQAFLSIVHPNVVRCLKTFVGLDKAVVILEYCPISLRSWIDHRKKMRVVFSNDEIYKVIVGYGRGIKALHDRNVMHRDIRPNNLLISDDSVYKLAEFRNCIQIDVTESIVGDGIYTAPEILQNTRYTNAVDIYSFGVVLHEMIMLLNPFCEINKKGKDQIKMNRAMEGRPNALQSPAHNAALLGLVRSMTAVKPDQRPKIDEVLQKDFILDYIARAHL